MGPFCNWFGGIPEIGRVPAHHDQLELSIIYPSSSPSIRLNCPDSNYPHRSDDGESVVQG